MKKINLYVSEDVWQKFRIECLKRETSASKEVEKLMLKRLKDWKSNAEEK